MKKLLSSVLAVLLCVSLCACAGVPKIDLPPLPTADPTLEPAAATPTPAPTMAPVPDEGQSVPAEGLKGSVIVSNKRTEKDAYDPQSGELLILRFSYDTPTVIIEENPEAADKINEFIGLQEESFYTGEDYGDGYGTGYNNMLTLAEDNFNYYASQETMEYAPLELSSALSVEVLRNDARVLALAYNESSYTGGAHGMYSERTYCFDPATGEQLTLANISADRAGLREFLNGKLVQIVQTDADIQERTQGFIDPDAVDTTLGALLRDGSWYFDYDGMVVFSDLYEISSYAAGIISFRIPYAELEGRIDSRFFPEQGTASGSFRALSAEDMKDGSTQIVDMLKVSGEGQTVYLEAEGEVRDVKITSVAYSGYFYDLAQLWSCSGLKDSALQLVTDIPDGMPNLKITWRDADGQQARYLTQSGEDGTLILMPVDSVEAVG